MSGRVGVGAAGLITGGREAAVEDCGWEAVAGPHVVVICCWPSGYSEQMDVGWSPPRKSRPKCLICVFSSNKES